jgi:predicted dehydrogenase
MTKTAVVTGAGTGVGRAIAHALAREGWSVALVGRTEATLHEAIARAAVAAKKHVLCEKPLALRAAAARGMYEAAEAAGVRHMTAFTYRFVPAMRYMQRLVRRGDVGRPIHFRAQRFQDWGDRAIGWRQSKELAGTGELADMLSHRIDYGHLLLGQIRALVADMRNVLPIRGGQASDVDDWVAALCQFNVDATGVLESTKLATGIGEGIGGADVVELNGDEASLAYSTQRPLELRIAKRGASGFEAQRVPDDLLVWPGSPRDPRDGDPLVTFRYDQVVEFIDAIASDRPCRPSFLEGAEAQAVMEAIETSARERRWVEPAYPSDNGAARGP